MTRTLSIAAFAIATGLAGCASTIDPVAGYDPNPRTPTEQWKADLVSQPEEILLAIHPDGFSPRQAQALSTFVQDWREIGGGTIVIQTPIAGVENALAGRAGEGARAFLRDHGVAPDQIRVVGYEPGPEGRPPLKVGYLRQTVSIPACGQEWTNIAHSAMNKVQPNFGCAVTANMAAQIANPADLAGPRASAPADAQRRVLMLEKYRNGEVTSSAKDDQANGAVSQVVN